jgi:hypothetical protein
MIIKKPRSYKILENCFRVILSLVDAVTTIKVTSISYEDYFDMKIPVKEINMNDAIKKARLQLVH